ncbi:Pectate lyase L precursor [Posidoniimonas corsicana]|uniref:Probable pectate lyase C n=1 Tax=Posidoniimonas corsicana TaxID=1938618 RepID=A0A5C5V152_9BACT|nr:right-handed parallel beta-helix repeat-containing protein [Posidoniimonas corsicana]TWT32188.1 Pectate lyase L precursor [Posidoniimonas corsicana]
MLHPQRLAALTLLLNLLGFAAACPAAEYYVAPTGSDGAPGSLAAPFGSLARAQQAAAPGDTVWIRGGEYNFVAGQGASQNAVLFNKSGAPRQRINYWAYPGETPVFDFSQYLPTERIRGFSVQADYLHFRGLELRGVQQTITNVNESWAIRVEGSGGDFNIFERLNLHHNEGPGLFIVNGGNNLVLNTDSHHNYDPDRGGENADGFGSHSNDDGNVFIGNRAWENSDDGYDFINSEGRVELIDSWAWRNGYIPDTNTPAGNGAGIKAGGFLLDSSRFPDPEDVPTNLVQGSVAFDNRVQGFYANHHPGGIDWVNNTAFDNPRGFDLLNDVDVENWPADHYLRNNIAYANGTNLANANQDLIDDEANTWNLRMAISPADFLSLDPTGVDGPRQPDGSLPEIDFLRLAPGSRLIDAGEDAGLDFYGLAPDLGAFESGSPGDFNNDGLVDAADYTVWRDNLGTVFGLSDYQVWLANYGAGADGASGAAPEPTAAAVLLVAAACCGRRATLRRRK